MLQGGAGFIGSAVVWHLNQLGEDKIIIIDELGTDDKWKNLVGLKFRDFMHKDEFIKRVKDENIPFNISNVVHMGACSSTTEKDADYLMRNNYQFSLQLCSYCMPRRSPVLYMHPLPQHTVTVLMVTLMMKIILGSLKTS